jgi:hypothetical protein
MTDEAPVTPAVKSAILDSIRASMGQLDKLANIVQGGAAVAADRDLYSKNTPGDGYSKNTSAFEDLAAVIQPIDAAVQQLRTKLSQRQQ